MGGPIGMHQEKLKVLSDKITELVEQVCIVFCFECGSVLITITYKTSLIACCRKACIKVLRFRYHLNSF